MRFLIELPDDWHESLLSSLKPGEDRAKFVRAAIRNELSSRGIDVGELSAPRGRGKPRSGQDPPE